MKKNVFVIAGLLLFALFTGCSFNEKLEEIGSRDSLMVLGWHFTDSDIPERNDLMDEDRIERVRDVFADARWEDSPEEEWTHPDYRIDDYQIWLADEDDQMKVIDASNGKFAELTKEETAIIFETIISALY